MFSIFLILALWFVISNHINYIRQTYIKNCFFEGNTAHAYLSYDAYYRGDVRLLPSGVCILEGTGMIIYKDNTTFYGKFSNNMKNGYGIYYLKNSNTYTSHVVSYTNNTASTIQTLFFKNGQVFTGHYDKKYKIYSGNMVYPNKTLIHGKWELENPHGN